METPSPCRRRVHGARALSSIDLNHAHFFPLLHLSFVIPDARCSTLSRPHRIPSQHQQHNSQQQLQLQQGLASAAETSAAQQAMINRLASIISHGHQWLHALANRCTAQHVELPIECAEMATREHLHPWRPETGSQDANPCRLALPKTHELNRLSFDARSFLTSNLHRCTNALGLLQSASSITGVSGGVEHIPHAANHVRLAPSSTMQPPHQRQKLAHATDCTGAVAAYAQAVPIATAATTPAAASVSVEITNEHCAAATTSALPCVASEGERMAHSVLTRVDYGSNGAPAAAPHQPAISQPPVSASSSFTNDPAGASHPPPTGCEPNRAAIATSSSPDLGNVTFSPTFSPSFFLNTPELTSPRMGQQGAGEGATLAEQVEDSSFRRRKGSSLTQGFINNLPPV